MARGFMILIHKIHSVNIYLLCVSQGQGGNTGGLSCEIVAPVQIVASFSDSLTLKSRDRQNGRAHEMEFLQNKNKTNISHTCMCNSHTVLPFINGIKYI